MEQKLQLELHPLYYINFAKERNLFDRNFLMSVRTEYHRMEKGYLKYENKSLMFEYMINTILKYKKQEHLLNQLPINDYTNKLKEILKREGKIDEIVYKHLLCNYL